MRSDRIGETLCRVLFINRIPILSRALHWCLTMEGQIFFSVNNEEQSQLRTHSYH